MNFLKLSPLLIILMVCLGSQSFAENKQGWAEQTLNQMSLEEKIGQLFVVTVISDADLLTAPQELFFKKAAEHAGLPYSAEKVYGNKEFIEGLIKNYHVGGLIYLGKARLASQIHLTNHFRALSKYPLFIAQDCEWGLNQRAEEAIHFPKSMTLGALINDTLIYEMGKEIGFECKAIGVNINLAPCVDVNVNYKNPVIHMRSFGDNEKKVATKAIAYMKGMQAAGILTCAKHFPGHGDTHVDSHVDLPRLDKTRKELEKIELYPFQKMIESDVDCIMSAHLEVPALDSNPQTPSSLSKNMITHLLREKMHFEGLIITDALIMEGVTKFNQAGQLELKALLAGNDLLLCPSNVPLAVSTIKEALAEGILSESVLDQHVLRILKAKEKLLDRGGFKNNISDQDLSFLKSPQAIALKDQLFSQAITLCGTSAAFPKVGAKVTLVNVGKAESPIFQNTLRQNFNLFPIFELEESITQAQFAKDISTIVFAINKIDGANHESYGIDQAVFDLIKGLKAQGHQVIVALFGTPYSLRLFAKEDTVIVAYENDASALKAAAEVITGQRKAIGILPIADGRR